MQFNLGLRRLFKISILALSLTVLCLSAFGCVGQQVAQGWSGISGDNGMLYFGSNGGNIMALNISARSKNLAFPSEGEWAIPVRAPATGGSICGPACAPAAQPAAIYATPVIAGDLVCVATYAGDNGKVMAINKNRGNGDDWPLRSMDEWVYPGETKSIGSVVGNLVLVGDMLYVGSSDGKLYALDVVYGEKKWDFDTGGKIWTSPAVSDGIVYVSNYAKELYAIKDGNEMWHKDYPSAIASSPTVADGIIFFGTFDNNLYAVSSSDGEVLWTFLGEKWFWVSPLFRDGVIYAGCLDQKVYAIKADTGKELWRFEADSSIVSQPVFAGDQLVVCSKSGSIYMLNLYDGTLSRNISIGHSVMASIYIDGNNAYVHATDKNIYCVDLQSGQIAWKFSSVIK